MNRFWNTFRASVRGVDTTGQMAWGVTLGMIIGLLPKDSAIVLIVGVALILTSNLLSGAISVAIFSVVAIPMEPVFHQFGMAVLGVQSLQSVLARGLEIPLFAWLRIENTVVVGSLLTGLIASFPLHRLSYFTLAKYRDSLVAGLNQSPITRWIVGYPEPEIQEVNS